MRNEGNARFAGSLYNLQVNQRISLIPPPSSLFCLVGSYVIVLSDEQAEVGSVYHAVEVEVGGGS